MKRIIGILIGLSLCVGSLLAAYGFGSGMQHAPEQNQFGGYGEIRSAGNLSQQYFCDDTTFYYPAVVASWGHVCTTMFACDLASGKCSSICKRISCTHRTADCPLHPLYQGPSSQESGYWNLIDNHFIAPKLTKDKFLITGWNAFTDKSEIIAELPRFNQVSDSAGLSGKYESFFNDAMRVTEDLLLIGYNNQMHIYDNTYRELYRFPCSGLLYPLVTGNRLFWLGMSNELNSIRLDTGELEYDLLKGVFSPERSDTILDSSGNFCAFSYENEIYFPHDCMIYAFDAEQHSVREIAQFDALTEDEPYACFGNENQMYYKCDGVVRCMNLEKGTVTSLPDLPKVPCAAAGNYLLFVRSNCTGEDADIACYDKDGKPVDP